MTKSKKRPTIQKPTTDDVPTTDTSHESPVPEEVPSTTTAAAVAEPTETNITCTIREVVAKKPAPKRAPATKKPKTDKLSQFVTMDKKPANDPHAGVQIANIILHLKCTMNDLHGYKDDQIKQFKNPLTYNPDVPPDLMAYQQTNQYSLLNSTNTAEGEDYAYLESKNRTALYQMVTTGEASNDAETQDESPKEDQRTDMKDIYAKLKKLKISLFKNMSFMDKKSACFWCTYDFDNPECYIPRYEMDGSIHGYGSFCRPECATAYLMKENLDDSTKFERYHLLNQIYSKVYDYKKNIKPAPNPYYMLDKYYGNLTIQEYRKLLKSDHLLLVIDKPLTRILPELHEDNEDFLTNIYGGTSNTTSSAQSSIAPGTNGVYKVRRQSDKQNGPTKLNILKEHFNLAS
jgi:hypothetical protein